MSDGNRKDAVTGPKLRQALQERLAERAPRSLQEEAPPTVRRAAVVLGVTELGQGARVGGLPDYGDWQRQPALLLTRRPAHMRRHAGQWALPGGRLDPSETPAQAALRELEEEVGLSLGDDAILGRLDDYETASGFIIRPLVLWLGRAEVLTLDPQEVASAHRIPFTELLRRDAPLLTPIDDSEHPVLRMPVGDDSIAAPTAALLYQFREWCLLGRSTPVAHFSEPHFARR
ncbi:MAG: CoA pyrophosphatase [Pseudomonadota bacterium]